MKALIKNKRGFAFPTVLGTFVLVTSIAAGLFIMISNMTLMVSSDTNQSNELFDARTNLNLFLDMIEKSDTQTQSNMLNELKNSLSLLDDLDSNLDSELNWAEQQFNQLCEMENISTTLDIMCTLGLTLSPESSTEVLIVVHIKDPHFITGRIFASTDGGGVIIDPENVDQTGNFTDGTVIDGNWNFINDSGDLAEVITIGEHGDGTLVINGDLSMINTATNDRSITVNGNIVVMGDLNLLNDNTGSATKPNDITINGDIRVIGNVNITTDHNRRDIIINGDIVAARSASGEGGNVTLTANENRSYIFVIGTIYAENSVTLTTDHNHAIIGGGPDNAIVQVYVSPDGTYVENDKRGNIYATRIYQIDHNPFDSILPPSFSSPENGDGSIEVER